MGTDKNITRCTCGAWVWTPRGHCATCGMPVEKRPIGPIALAEGMFGSLIAGPHGPVVRHSNGQGGIRLLDLTVHEP